MASFGHELINTLKQVTRDDCMLSIFIFPYERITWFLYNFEQFLGLFYLDNVFKVILKCF